MHIAVAGNIGAGKTTLTHLLSKHYRWEAHFEDVVDNPYLDDFYTQMERWSFNLQIYFLNSRYRQILRIRESGKNVIQDRTIYEDAHIFARALQGMETPSGGSIGQMGRSFACQVPIWYGCDCASGWRCHRDEARLKSPSFPD